MGGRIRAFDWGASPLGPPDDWPQSLRSALSICLQSSFPTAIYWGPELRVLYNDAWAPIPADRHPWALGQPAAMVWTDIWDVVGPQFRRVMETGEGLSTFDQMLPMERGGRIHETYWNYSLTPIRGEDGSIVGLFNQGHETTDRVLAERRSVAERERLRRMFDQAPGFMAMLQGPDHIFELTNAAYMQLIGHRDVIGKPVRDALPEVGGQGFFELLDHVFETGEAFVGTAMKVELQRAPDQPTEERHVDLVYQPVVDDTGTVTGIFVEGADVSERVRAEAELRRSEERFRELIESAPDKMWINEPDGSVSYFNAAWRNYTGCSVRPDGTSWMDSIHPDDRERMGEHRRRAIDAREAYEIEVRICRLSDRAWRWHVGRVAPVRRNGEIFAWVGMAADIDDVRRAQQALADLNATLETRVLERTAALNAANDQLRQTQKMEAIGQLTGGLAHDLNNMLTVVTGNLDIAGRSIDAQDQAKAHRAIGAAMKGAQSAASLTTRLLAFARRQPLSPRALDLGELVQDMVELLARAVGETIELKVAVPSGLPSIFADPHQLENAILNLAVNARDAMVAGGTLSITAIGVRIEAPQALELELAAGDYVQLSAEDTGSGMAPDVVARVFEPFFTTKAQGKGTGLGLSMVYGFAKQSGGTVLIESTQGVGTCVRMLFPATAAQPLKPEIRPTPASELRGSETVLLVEDQADVSDLVQSILSGAGYHVLTASSGDEALRIVERISPPDLLFTDVVMPGRLSGFTLAEEVRRLSPQTMVLLTSGYSIELSTLTSQFPLLSKPYQAVALLAAVRNALDREEAVP